ncbi:hypothetical protein CRG98_016978 [Punica granatum]|uniref:Uncharacterized protein n=1 Tax=Punica granatum TaxID=22663 RepID=A0A2I0K4J4_PUNGR|nr:hypothetical protein CRG98_016978 [Punica granatum]
MAQPTRRESHLHGRTSYRMMGTKTVSKTPYRFYYICSTCLSSRDPAPRAFARTTAHAYLYPRKYSYAAPSHGTCRSYAKNDARVHISPRTLSGHSPFTSIGKGSDQEVPPPPLRSRRWRRSSKPFNIGASISIEIKQHPRANRTFTTVKAHHRQHVMTSPEVLQAARAMADSDFQSLGICRRFTSELESLIIRPGHPQRTTIASAVEPASSITTSNHPNGEAGLRQINTQPPLQ